MATRDQLLDYLTRTRDTQNSYHNSKETLGWAGVALYLAGTLQLQSVVKSPISSNEKLALSVGTGIASLFFIAYCRRQFNLRHLSAQLNWALSVLAAETIAGIWDRPPRSRLLPPPLELPQKDDPKGWWKRTRLALSRAVQWLRTLIWPKRIDIDDQRDSYPPFVIEKAHTWGATRKDRKGQQLEYLTYAMMLATGTVSCLGWWFAH